METRYNSNVLGNRDDEYQAAVRQFMEISARYLKLAPLPARTIASVDSSPVC